MAQPVTVMTMMTMIMVQREEEECLMAEEHACKAKKLRHKELDLEMLTGQEWEPGVLSRLRVQLWALLHAPHPQHMPNQDVFVFELDRQEDVEIAALYEQLQGLRP